MHLFDPLNACEQWEHVLNLAVDDMRCSRGVRHLRVHVGDVRLLTLHTCGYAVEYGSRA